MIRVYDKYTPLRSIYSVTLGENGLENTESCRVNFPYKNYLRKAVRPELSAQNYPRELSARDFSKVVHAL